MMARNNDRVGLRWNVEDWRSDPQPFDSWVVVLTQCGNRLNFLNPEERHQLTSIYETTNLYSKLSSSSSSFPSYLEC